MITFIVHVRVKPENQSAFEALLTHVVDMTRKHEPDVAYYGFARSVEEPEIFVVTEVYGNAQAQEQHMATDWVRDSLPKSARLIEGKPDIKQYVSEGSAPVVRRVKL
jgi:quinol monooxygenase YgiN